MKGQRWAAP